LWTGSRAALLSAALLAAAVPLSPARATAPLDPASTELAREGLEHLYHGRTAEAERAFERIRELRPESPAPDFLIGGIHWHELITGPSGVLGPSRAERAFFSRLDAAIEIGEKRIAENPDDLSARFFLGGALGYQARYLALKEKWWDAYRTGRRGLKQLETVIERDPDFSDAYLGLGIYHYYADVLPSVLKLFAGLVGLGGDAERGLEEIRRALREGTLVEQEARFFLAEIYTSFEEDHWTAFAYARSLHDEYPESELFTWIDARILDELHLADEAEREWESLRGRASGRRLAGFLEYRLARSRLFGGDFAGAEKRLAEALPTGRLGSRRMAMWGRLRHGQALDLLGRHVEALAEYRLASEMDASDTAKRRAVARVDAGRRDPTVLSLEELAEAARILRETGPHEERLLRDVEAWTVEPSRGLSPGEKRTYFGILADLAEARLRAGDPEGCLACLERAMKGSPKPPKEARGMLLAKAARAHWRAGRPDRAIAELKRAIAKGDWDQRARARRELALLENLIASGRTGEASEPAGLGVGGADDGATALVSTRDRGELTVEVEVERPGGIDVVPARLRDGRWFARLPAAGGATAGAPPVRWRLLVDRERVRVDPAAARVVVDGDVIWGEGLRAGR
jgi:tetratricopeptide (TPR) repeat protein